MNKEKVFIEGYEVGFQIDTLGTREKIIQLVSGETVSIDENFIYKSIEQEKVTIPQDVADWIEYCKVRKITLAHALYRSEEAKNKSVYRWIFESLDHQETFALAWIFGYEVEKEKRYLVKVKGVNDYCCYLNKGLLSKEYFLESKAEIGGCRTKHTRKQLEEAGFGWVFDCEGIEIEEVE